MLLRKSGAVFCVCQKLLVITISTADDAQLPQINLFQFRPTNVKFRDLCCSWPQGFHVIAGVRNYVRSYTELLFTGRCSTPAVQPKSCSGPQAQGSKHLRGRQLATATVPSPVAVTELPCTQSQKSGYQWGFASPLSPPPNASGHLTARTV